MKHRWKFATIVLALLLLSGCATGKTADVKDEGIQNGSESIEDGFVFEIDDVFFIDETTVATGKAVSGTLNRGDAVILLKADGTQIETTAVKLEIFRQELDKIVEGDNASVYLADLQKTDVEIGDKLVTAVTKQNRD